MGNIMGYFRKSRNTLEKGGITPKAAADEKMRCPVCKSYESKRVIAKQKARRTFVSFFMACNSLNRYTIKKYG